MSKAVPRPGEITLPEDSESLAEFEALLAYLKQSRGFDFTAYKRSSLMRRVMVRMQTMGSRDSATTSISCRSTPRSSPGSSTPS